ncbi:MAG: NAD(P)-binding protein, partial [Actinobacteria bacterium]|nr:NAD(P)-binding protein [Actinomycetota bacterium]
MRNLRDISIPPLLAALAQATGDRSLLRADLAPDPARKLEPHGGLNSHQQDEAVALAEAAIAYLNAGGAPLVEVDEAFLRETMEFCLGTEIEDQTFRMLREELALPGEDMRAPDWSVESLAPGRSLRALIIGAGMSGILSAHRLMQAGIEVQLIEKGKGIGGTWRENRYPGCRVDVPNHLYSYSFAARADWRQQFSAQPVLLKYFEDVAEDLAVTERVSFGVEVIDATWDEAQT